MNKKGRWCCRNKKGQVTIFIILGIIIVALGFLIYSFYPQIKSTIGGEEKNPQSYIQSCIEEEIKGTVEKLSLQGGSISPSDYANYFDTNVEYLCYTSEFYRPCIVQQPMLKQHIESEIKSQIDHDVDACFDSLKSSYEKRGYTVELKRGEKRIELLPKRIVATFNYSMTFSKGDTQKYDSFSVVLNDNLYELSSIANSITEWESVYGDVDITTYMTYYPDLKVERKPIGEGSRVYILTDRNTGNKFQFAIKSQVWPAGYAKSTA
jgi:hypothetical protein